MENSVTDLFYLIALATNTIFDVKYQFFNIEKLCFKIPGLISIWNINPEALICIVVVKEF